MAEFTELPIAAGPLVPRDIYNEILNAINNRRVVRPFRDAAAAFTIYNSAADATSATVEIDTAADEMYLIVIGGADASNTTLDLTAAAHDTITELVAVINALGFSWVAVEKAGSQTAHANNKSDTLLSLGPANTLSAARITWFTNYAPNGVISEKLFGDIVAYRAAIDTLIPYFYEPASRTAYTVNTLHTAAFGDNDWDAAGAPYLTPPCLTHKKLWNDMKACLDLMKWVLVNDQPTSFSTSSSWFQTFLSGPVWNTERAAWFADAAELSSSTHLLGRAGRARLSSGDYDIREASGQTSGNLLVYNDEVDGNPFQLGPYSTTAPAIDDGALALNTQWWTAGSAPDYPEDWDMDIYIEGVKAHTASFTMQSDYGTENTWVVSRLDDTDAVTFIVNGNNNDLRLDYIGDLSADPGAGVWPAPAGATLENFAQCLLMHDYELYLKFSWD